MRAYLDTSVIHVLLFGKYSKKDKNRVPDVKKLFSAIDAGLINTVISLYSVQEIFAFCKLSFAPSDAGIIARQALADLFKYNFELTGLLTRMERLIYKRNFKVVDTSDIPHAISAQINNCDIFVTYDHHFNAINDGFRVLTPHALLQELDTI